MTDCPYKVGDKIEGKEVIEGFLGVIGNKEVWHVAVVEKVDGNLMKLHCSSLYGEQRVWFEYQEGWFREHKEAKSG